MEKEKRNQLLVAGAMLLIGGAIVYFAASFMNPKTDTGSTGSGSGYSQDNASEPYRTLSYVDAGEELNKDGNFQAYYIGCRDCGYCVQLEDVLKDFLAKHQDKNADRNLIHKIEAGYSCIPKTSDSDYSDYVKIYDFLLVNNVIAADSDKAFGTPQFVIVKNGKIVDKLDNYGRSVDGLEQLFVAQKYRGF